MLLVSSKYLFWDLFLLAEIQLNKRDRPAEKTRFLIGKRSPRYLDLPDLKKHMQFIDQKRLGTVSSSQQP